jgi:hypothetical protein
VEILFALLTLLVGVALLFGGFRLARIIIPIWGFVAGLSIGGTIIANMASTPFLGTALGIVIGLLLGAVFALISYLYYSVAVLVLVGAVGFWAGSNFIMLLGINPGLLTTLSGVVLGLLLAIGSLIVDVPKYLLIFATAMGGAMAVVGSLLLMFNQIPLSAFNYATVNQSVSGSFGWTLVALVLMVTGIATQTRTTTDYQFEEWEWGKDHSGQGVPHATPVR